MWLKIAKLFLGIVTLYVLYTSYCWQEDYQYMSTGFDVGEALIDTHDVTNSPYESAHTYMNEAQKLWATDGEHWKVEMTSSQLNVSSVPIHGPLSRLNLPIQRARLRITSYLDKDALFGSIVSFAGLATIDPISARDSALAAPLMTFEWFRGRLEVSLSLMHMPWPFSTRETPVFNIIDNTQCVYISTSTALSEQDRQLVPPQYRPEGMHINRPKQGSVVAHKYFALKVEELGSGVSELSAVSNLTNSNATTSRVRHRYLLHMLAVNADIVPWTVLSYYMNSKLYFPMVSRGLIGAFSVPVNKRKRTTQTSK